MMTREHHRRRSPEYSRRRRKERRDSREQLQIQPVPLPLTRYEERDEHQEERSRAFSPLSSSSSTSSSLLNISRPSQRFGLGRFFGGGQKQHRVKKKRRFLKFGNSSSSSVGSDLAYGKGYIEKGRSRDFSPTSSNGRSQVVRRSQTDEEILELGRKFAEIARQQNAEDLRAAGRSRPSTLIGAASALNAFRRTNSGNSNRGIGSSKPRRDSSPDDSEWESASEDEDDSSSSEFDSGLAYGSGLSLQASAAPPPQLPQSPKSPKSPPRSIFSSPRSLISPRRSPAIHQKQSVVDPSLFGPVNSLHGYVETPCGFEKVDRSTVSPPHRPYEPSIPPSEVFSETRPLQRLYPVPTSDPSNFDAGGSVVSSNRDFSTRARPAPVPIQPPPLQQPKPIAPVSRKVLDSVETDTRYSERSVSKSTIGETAIAGIAGAAIGAALSSDRRDDRDKRENKRERDRDGKRRSKRSDPGVQDERTDKRKSREDVGETREIREERVDRRREKRYEPDRESERERHWREHIVPELKRESEEKRRRDDYDSDHDYDNVRDKREDKQKEDREIDRREVRKDEKRDGRRDKDRTSRSTVESYKRQEKSEYQSREGHIDPFQFQVADDAFPTPLYTTPKRPLTPNVVTVEREPDFSRFEYKGDDSPPQERLSRKDSYERELRDAHDVYEATEHATAPVSGAAFAAATAAILAEERRGRSHSRGGDASSRNRSRRGESPRREKDAVQENANRYYREAELARRIKEEDERARSDDESSVVDKWRKPERKKAAVEIVQPPEMDHPKKKSPYDAPNADVRIDNVLQHPDELSRFQSPDIEGLSQPPLFNVRDPSAERERPMLNIVRPTPVPSPMPEETRSAKEPPSEPTKEVDTPKSNPTPDVVIEPRDEAPPAPPTPKSVSWGENQTKRYVVESPEREDDPYSGAKIVTPAKTPRARRRSAWEKIAAAIGGAEDEATSSGTLDRKIDTDPTKPRRDSVDRATRRFPAEIESAYDSPPVPGPKPSILKGSPMPGTFAEDPAFTANIAAALEGSGFDPNIVIDNASFHRRDSPPGSNESGVYQAPFVESVTDLGSNVAPRPLISQNNQEHGFVIGEVSETPSDEKDISTDNSLILSELNKKDRRKQEKVVERDGYEKPKIIVDDSRPADTSRSSADDDWDPASGKLSRKERKRRERAARAQSVDDGIALDDASRKDQELEAEFMGAAAADEEESSSLKKKKKAKRAVIVQEASKQPDVAESSKVTIPVDAFQDIQDAKAMERPKITIPVNAYQDVLDAKDAQLDDTRDLRKSSSESKRDAETYDLPTRSLPEPEHLEQSIKDILDSRAPSIPEEERDSPRKSSRRSKRDSGAYESFSRTAPPSELTMESSYGLVDNDRIPATEEGPDTPTKSRKKSERGDSEIFGPSSRPALTSEPSIEIVTKDGLPETTPNPDDDQNVFMKRNRRGTIDAEFTSSPAQSTADWYAPKESSKSKLDSVVYDLPPRVESSEDIVESPKEMTAPFSDWRDEPAAVAEEQPSTPKKSKKKSKRDSIIQEELPSTPVSRSATPSLSSAKKSKRDSVVFDSPSRSAPTSDIGTDSSPKKSKKKKKRPSTPGDFPEDDGKPSESEPPDQKKDSVEVSNRDFSSILSEINRSDDQRPGKVFARVDTMDDGKSIPGAADRKERKDTKSGGFFNRFRSSIGIAEEKERSRNKAEEDKKNSFLDNADTLGAGVGSMGVAITPSPQESRSNAINAPLEEAQIAPSTPKRQSTSPSEAEIVDPEIAPREIRPAIDPKYGDLLPLPPSRPGSPVPELSDDFPDLPESRPETPEHERHLREIHSHVRRRSAHETPTKTPTKTPTTRPRTPSQSAIPISFRLGHRHTPSNGRSSPLASPIVGNSEMGSESKSRSRPISWEGSREFKPLLLLQRGARGSIGSVGSLEISSSPERESPLRDVSPSESEIHEHRSQSLRRLLAGSPDHNPPMRDSAFTIPAYTTPGVTTPSEPNFTFESTHGAESPQTPDDSGVNKLSHESPHQRDIEVDDHHLEPVPEQPILEAAEDTELPLPKSEFTETAFSSDELSPLTAKRPSDIHFPPSPSTTVATHERGDFGETIESPVERSVEVVVPRIEMTEPTPKESELPTTHSDLDLTHENEFVDSLEAQDKEQNRDMLTSYPFLEAEASRSVDTLLTAMTHFEDTEPDETVYSFEESLVTQEDEKPQELKPADEKLQETKSVDELPQETQLVDEKVATPPEIPTNVEVAQIQEEPRRRSRILEQLRAAQQAKESKPVERSVPIKESPPAESSKEEVQQPSGKADTSDAKQAAPSPFQPLDQGGWLSSFRSSWRSGLLPRPWQLPKASDSKEKENDSKSATTSEATSSVPPSVESREVQPPEETLKETISAPEPEPEPEASNVQQDVSTSPKKSKKKKKRKSQVIEPSPDQFSVADVEEASVDKTNSQATENDQPDPVVPQESVDVQPIIVDTEDTALDKTTAEPAQDVLAGAITQEPLDVEPVAVDTQDSGIEELSTNLPRDEEPDVQTDVIVPRESLDVKPDATDARDASVDTATTQIAEDDQLEVQQEVLPGFQPDIQSDAVIPQESIDVRPVVPEPQDTSLDKAFTEPTSDDQPDTLPDVQPDVIIPQESLNVQPTLTDTKEKRIDETFAEPTKGQHDIEAIVESHVQPDVITQEPIAAQLTVKDAQDIDSNKSPMQLAEDNLPDVLIPQESLDVQPHLTEEAPAQEETIVTEEFAETGKELGAVEETPTIEPNAPLNEHLPESERVLEPIAAENESSITDTMIDAEPAESITKPEATLPESQTTIEPDSLIPQPNQSVPEAEIFTPEPESIATELVVPAIEEESNRDEVETKETATTDVEPKETTVVGLETTGVGKEIPPVEVEPTVVESDIPSSKPELIVEPEPVVAEKVDPIADAELIMDEIAPRSTEKEVATAEELPVVEDEMVEAPTPLTEPSSSSPKKEKKKKKKKGKKQQPSENDQDEPATPLEELVQPTEQSTQESNVEKPDVLPVEPEASTQDLPAAADIPDASLDKAPAQPDQPDQSDVAIPQESHDAQPSLPEEIPSTPTTPKKFKKKKRGKKTQTSEPEPEAEIAGEQVAPEEEKSQPPPVEVSSPPIMPEVESTPQPESHRPHSAPIGDVEVVADHTEPEHQLIPPAEEKSVSENLPSEEPQTVGEFGRDEESSRQITGSDEPAVPVSVEPVIDSLDDRQPLLPSNLEQEERVPSASQLVSEEVQLPSEILKSEEPIEFSIPQEDPNTEQQHDEQHMLMETSSESPVAQDSKSLEQVNVDESSLQPNVLLSGEHARDHQVPASIAPLETPLSEPNSTEGLQEKSPEQIEVVQEPESSGEKVVIDEPQSSSLSVEPIVEQPQEMALPEQEPGSKKGKKSQERKDTSELVDTPVETPADIGTTQELPPPITPTDVIVDELPVAGEVEEKPAEEATELAGDNSLPEPTKSSKKSKKGKKKRQKSDATDLTNEPETPQVDAQAPEPITIEDHEPATNATEPAVESASQAEAVTQVTEEQAKDTLPALPSEAQESVNLTEEGVQPGEKLGDNVQAINPDEQAEPIQIEELPQPEEPLEPTEATKSEEPSKVEESVQIQEPIAIEEPPQPEPLSNVERSLELEQPIKAEEPTRSEEFMQAESTLEAPAEVEVVELPSKAAGDVIQGIDSENQTGPTQIQDPSKLDVSLQPTESTQPETSEVSEPIADRVEPIGDNVPLQDSSSKVYEEEGKETRQIIDAPALTDEPESSKSVEEPTVVETGAEDRQIADDAHIPTSDLGPAAGDQLEEAQAPEPESPSSKKQAKKDKKKKKKRGSVQSEPVADDIPRDASQASDAQPVVNEQHGASDEVTPQIDPPANVDTITEDTQVHAAQNETEDKELKPEELKVEESEGQLPTVTEETPVPPTVAPEISAEPSTIPEETEQPREEGLETESVPTTPKKSKKDRKKKRRQSVQLAESSEQTTMEASTQPDVEFPESDPAFKPDSASADIPPPSDDLPKPEDRDDKSDGAERSLIPETPLPDEAVEPLDQPSSHIEPEQKPDILIDEGDKLEPQDTTVPMLLEDARVNEPEAQPPVETSSNDVPHVVQERVDEVLPIEEQIADDEPPVETDIAQEPAVHEVEQAEEVRLDQDIPVATDIPEAVQPQDEVEQTAEAKTETDIDTIPHVDEPTTLTPTDVEDDRSREQKQVDSQPIAEDTPTTVMDAASPEDTLPEVSTPKKKSKKKKKRASQVDLALESGTATPSEPQAEPALPEEAPVQEPSEQPESQPIVEESAPTKEEVPEIPEVPVTPSKLSKKERRKAKKLAEAEAEAAKESESQRNLLAESGLTESAGAEAALSQSEQPAELPKEQPSEQPTEPTKPISEVDLPADATTSKDIQEESLQLPVVDAEPSIHSDKDRIADSVESTVEEMSKPTDQDQELSKPEQTLITSPELENVAKDLPTDVTPDQFDESVKHIESNQESNTPIVEDKPDMILEEPSVHLGQDRPDVTEITEDVASMPVNLEQSVSWPEQDSNIPLESENVAKDMITNDTADTAVIETKTELLTDATALPTTISEQNEETDRPHTPKLEEQEIAPSDSVSRDLPDPKEGEIVTIEKPILVEEQQQVEPSDILEPSKTSETKDIEQKDQLPADQDVKLDDVAPKEPEPEPSSPVSRKKSKKKKKRASVQAELESVSGTQTPSNQETILSGEPSTTNTTEPASREPVDTKPNEGEWPKSPAKSKKDRKRRKATGTSTPTESMEVAPANAPSGTVIEENAPGKLTQEDILEVEGHSSTKEIHEEPSPNPENQDENAEDFKTSHLLKETVADSNINQLAPPTEVEHRAQRNEAPANEPAQDIQSHVEISAPISPPRTPITTATPMIDIDLSPAQLSSHVEHDRPFDQSQSPQPGKKARTHLSSDDAMIEPLSALTDIPPQILETSTREIPEAFQTPDQHMIGTDDGDAPHKDITPAREIAVSYLESQPTALHEKHTTKVEENPLIEKASHAGLLPVVTPQREIAASYFEERSIDEIQTDDNKPEDKPESVAGGAQIKEDEDTSVLHSEPQPTEQEPEHAKATAPEIAREPSPIHDAAPSAREIAASLMESRPKSSGKQSEPPKDLASSTEDVSFTFPTGGATLSVEDLDSSQKSEDENKQQKDVDKATPDKEDPLNDSTAREISEHKTPGKSGRTAARPSAEVERTKTPSKPLETKPLGDLPRQDSFPENIESPIVGREVQRMQRDLPEPRESSQETAAPREPPASEIIKRLDDLDTSENVDEPKSAKEPKLDNALLKSLSPRPILDYSSSGRNSPRVSLPPVEEETREEIEKERRQSHASKRSSVTVEPNRDSGFSTDSPHPKRRSLADPSLRDSGVHLRDWIDDEPKKAVESPEEEQGSAIRTPQPNEKRSKKLGLGNDTPKLETPITRSQESDAQPVTDPKKLAQLSRSSSKTSKSYGDLGQQVQQQRSVSDNISRTTTTPRSEGLPQARRSLSNTSISRFSRTRTPDPLRFRPESPGSYTFNRSGNYTPPLLRRVDRRMSGDLRSLSSNLPNNDETKETKENLHTNQNLNQSTPTPIANEGRVRAKDMTDVYDGYGEGRIGSPRSPTRPQSMRRRQSMQVLELESRVEQLIAENRALADAKLHAEQNLNNQAVSAITERDAEIESLKASLEWLRKEVTRLTEINEGLHSANNVLALKHNEKYGQLESRHASTSKQLEEFQSTRDQFNRTLEQKDAEIQELRAQLEATKEQVREMQQQILATKPPDAEFLRLKDEDHFDHRCQQLCSHVQQWVLRFSKFSDMRACRLTTEINDEKIIDRLDNAVLDGSDVDTYLSDRVRRRDIFMSMTMNMIWEFVFTRYLFGMDREQRQKLKSLEKLLQEVGPPQAVRQWRAVTLTLLSKRPAFGDQRNQDTEAVVQAIFQTLCMILPPPSNLEAQIQSQLRRVMREAVDLSIEMRTQRAEYMMLPPLQPEYDGNGDLARTVSFNAALMNERSGDKKTNDQYEAEGAVVRTVLFPLVVKKGDDNGVGDEEIVICPAQVLVAKPPGHAPARMVTPSSDAGGVPLSRGATPSMSAAGQSTVSVQMQDAPLPMPTPPHERDYI
ncbi:hypothetical protein F4806DRAFT_350889 [Annulohypoxylon nitens]|nr:hypothetical protein F4806DRAFT_350889 [Annulohypoxylon nitens]